MTGAEAVDYLLVRVLRVLTGDDVLCLTPEDGAALATELRRLREVEVQAEKLTIEVSVLRAGESDIRAAREGLAAERHGWADRLKDREIALAAVERELAEARAERDAVMSALSAARDARGIVSADEWAIARSRAAAAEASAEKLRRALQECVGRTYHGHECGAGYYPDGDPRRDAGCTCWVARAHAALSDLAPPPAQAPGPAAAREGAKDGTRGMAELGPETGREAQEPVTSAPQSSGDNEAAPPPSGDTSIPDAKGDVPGASNGSPESLSGRAGGGTSGGAAPNPPTSSPASAGNNSGAAAAHDPSTSARQSVEAGPVAAPVSPLTRTCCPSSIVGAIDAGGALFGNAGLHAWTLSNGSYFCIKCGAHGPEERSGRAIVMAAEAERKAEAGRAYVAALERVAEAARHGRSEIRFDHHALCPALRLHPRSCVCGFNDLDDALAALRTAREEPRHG